MSRGTEFRAEVLADSEPEDPAAIQLLDAACATLDELELLEKDVRERGVMIDGARGQLVAHPGLAAIARHRALLAKLLDDLLPDGEPETASQQAARAARARWGRR